MGRRTWQGQKIVVLEKEEEPGYNRFVEAHYKAALMQAHEIVKTSGQDYREPEQVEIALFEKLASPLVYLPAKWRDLSVEEKLEYQPDKTKRIEQMVQLSAKVREQLK